MNAKTVLDRLKNLGKHEIMWLEVSVLADEKLYTLKVGDSVLEYKREFDRLAKVSQYCMGRAIEAGKKRIKYEQNI
jgi:hypothetical protein